MTVSIGYDPDLIAEIAARFDLRKPNQDALDAIVQELAKADGSFAELVADRFNRGRPISREDAQIAASCLATGAALATRNAKVFDETPGLTVINPWKAAG